MAVNKYQVVEVSSDVSGEKGATTVTYSYKGQSYSIDLTETEDKEFHDLLTPYIAVSQVGKRRAPRVRSNPEETAKVREWAAKNGYTLNESGRIPNDVRKAYADAQNAPAPAKKAAARRPVKKATTKAKAKA